MAAYFLSPSRPVLLATTITALRAEPSELLKPGMLAHFSTAGAGALFTKGVYWDPTSVAADDGASVFKPDDVSALDPGRWLTHPGLSNVNETGNFMAPVIHVNWLEGANDPVPAVICGLSVDRGSVAGVERDRAIIVWDESNGIWIVGFDDAGDDQTVTALAPLQVGGLYSLGYGTSGFIRMRQDFAITADIGGNTRQLARGTAADVAEFGHPDFDRATLDANNDVTITSRLSDVIARGFGFQVKDASGVNTYLDLDIATLLLSLFAAMQQGNSGGAGVAKFGVGTNPQTNDATPTTIATFPVPANGGVTVLVLTQAVQSDGSNRFGQLSAHQAVRAGAAAPTLSAGAPGTIIATFSNTFAIVRPSFQGAISGNDLALQNVGKAGTTINWVNWYVALTR